MSADEPSFGARLAEELRQDADAERGNGVDRDDGLFDNPDRLRILHWATLATREPPPRFWHLSDWLGDTATLCAGRGGAGKTSIMQASATALVTGCEYFTAAPEAPIRVLMWCCEDSHDELWRRQVAINTFLGVSMADLQNRLFIEARHGLENTLFTTVYGAPCFTGLRDELREQIGDYKADVLILDNVGQLFGANGNETHPVTAFVNGVYGTGAALVPHFAPIFVGHVSRSQGSEFSGSLAWENACRMRWYVGPTLPDQQPDEDEPPTPDTVYLARRKANYTQKDYVQLTYQNGLFIPPGVAVAEYDPGAKTAEQVVLAAFDKIIAAGIVASDGQTSANYLPAVIKRMGLSRTFSKKELGFAMSRLMGQGVLKRAAVGQYGNRSPRYGLIRP